MCVCVRMCVCVLIRGVSITCGELVSAVNVLYVTPISCVMSWVVEGYVCGGLGGCGDIVSVVWVIKKGCGDSVCVVIGGAEGRWRTCN